MGYKRMKKRKTIFEMQYAGGQRELAKWDELYRNLGIVLLGNDGVGYKNTPSGDMIVYDWDDVEGMKFIQSIINKNGLTDNRMFVDVTLAGNPITDCYYDPNTGVITLKGGDAERMKWFESPNAEGYLKL